VDERREAGISADLVGNFEQGLELYHHGTIIFPPTSSKIRLLYHFDCKFSDV